MGQFLVCPYNNKIKKHVFMNKQIAIWAPLRYANYGDDMQALAFALLLKKEGYDVKLFQLEDSLAKEYGLKSCKTVDELCRDVNLCVIAGGALLTPSKWYKRILHKTTRVYEQDFGDLLDATYKNPNLRFCAISYGGDGIVRDPKVWLGRNRREVFSSASFIDGTVRLKGDVDMMRQLGKNVSYHADMLFQAAKYFTPRLLPPTKKYRVGFNFKKGKYLDKQLLKDIFDYAENHDDMEFHFTTTHMQKIGMDYQYLPECELKNVFINQYENPRQLLGVLASMDSFMTSMLHVGLTGLTTGTPFISYRGPGKTKTFLKEIGGEWAILPEHITFEQLKNQFWSKSRKELYSKYDTTLIEKMKADSQFHYDFCKQIAAEFA